MTSQTTLRMRYLRGAALAVFSSGCLFTNCATRFKEVAVDGATAYLFSLLDPATIVSQLLDSGDTNTGV